MARIGNFNSDSRVVLEGSNFNFAFFTFHRVDGIDQQIQKYLPNFDTIHEDLR